MDTKHRGKLVARWPRYCHFAATCLLATGLGCSSGAGGDPIAERSEVVDASTKDATITTKHEMPIEDAKVPDASPAPPRDAAVVKPPLPKSTDTALLGELDLNFGSAGIFWMQGPADEYHRPLALADVDDGILVAGTTATGPGKINFAREATVWRLDASGVPNPNFGSAGEWRGSSTEFDQDALSLRVGPEGLIYVGGRRNGKTNHSAASLSIWRLDATGTIDGNWGLDGVASAVISPLTHVYGGRESRESGAFWTRASDLAFDASGRLMAAGLMDGSSSHVEGAALWRFTSSGLLDETFHEDGVTYFFDGAQGPRPETLLIADNGANFLVGYSRLQGRSFVWNFAADGQPDQAYGAGTGPARSPAGASIIDSGLIDRDRTDLFDGHLDDHGRITAVGVSMPTGIEGISADRHFHLTLLRLTPEGKLDPTFGRDGLRVDGPEGNGRALAVGVSGTLFVCGAREQAGIELPAVWAFDINGRPHTNFGIDGVLTFERPDDSTAPGQCDDMIVSHSGLIYIAGSYRHSPQEATPTGSSWWGFPQATDDSRVRGFVARVR